LQYQLLGYREVRCNDVAVLFNDEFTLAAPTPASASTSPAAAASDRAEKHVSLDSLFMVLLLIASGIRGRLES
jgi:hypothetical protein